MFLRSIVPGQMIRPGSLFIRYDRCGSGLFAVGMSATTPVFKYRMQAVLVFGKGRGFDKEALYGKGIDMFDDPGIADGRQEYQGYALFPQVFVLADPFLELQAAHAG